MTHELLFVCTSCDRHARPVPKHRDGRILADSFAAYFALHPELNLEIREVACLSGCLKPCNVVLRGAGRPTVRFSQINAHDTATVAAIAAVGRQYWNADAGAAGFVPDMDGLSAELRVTATPAAPLQDKTPR